MLFVKIAALSRFQDPRARIMGPGFGFQDPVSRILDPGPVCNPGSRILDPVPRILGPGPSLHDPGSVI